ncbi:MAG: hypothetical protein AAGA58_12115 [Verrucomicrobiota bacterium]
MKKLWAWFKSLRFQPFAYSHVELLFVRAILAWMVWDVYQNAGTWSVQADPVGIARFVDLTIFANEEFHRVTATILLFCCAAYVFGLALPVVLLFMIVLLIGTETLENSQGSTNHNTQILALCLIGQWIWQIIAIFRKGWNWSAYAEDGREREQVSTWVGLQIVASCYVVSGISKILGDGNWVLDSVNYPLQLIKTERMSYYNDLIGHVDENVGWLKSIGLWMREMLIAYPWINPFVLSIGLILELVAFAALLGRVPALVLGLLLISFHFIVHLIMDLTFQYNILLLIAFFVGVPYWMGRFFRRST